MTAAIEIEMTAGRYHATPWDAHVNEGRVEWPPSPWRILRALLAVGFTKLGWAADAVPDDAVELIELLSVTLPHYRLPPATEAHSRHYMPVRDGRNEKTTKVIDAFLVFGPLAGDRTLTVAWPALDLSAPQRRLLADLVGGMAYLGRAESWAEARLLATEDAEGVDSGTDSWAVPAGGGARDERARSVRLLAGEPDFSEWRATAETRVADHAELTAHRKAQARDSAATPAAVKTARKKAGLTLPVDRVASLMLDNAVWQKQGWERPPGSSWVDYVLPRASGGTVRRSTRVRQTVRPEQAALLALDGAGKQGAVLPERSRGLPLASALHAAAVSIYGKLLDEAPPRVFTGCDENKNPLRGPHPHAHWLPLCLDGGRQIDHVLVYAPGPDGQGWLDGPAVATLGRLRQTYSKGIDRLNITLVGVGSIEDFCRSLQPRQQQVAELARGQVWRSVTPYVPRLWIGRGRKRIENQVNDELRERNLPEAEVEVLPLSAHIGLTKHVIDRDSSRRSRTDGPTPDRNRPPLRRHALQLRFADSVRGPITLGRNSHFGLGLFEAVDDPSAN